jgi:hypothetical protein
MSTDRHPSPLRRARHLLRTYATEHPALYLPFARRKYPGPSPEVISSETELVIDGYTRCGSTRAVYALQFAQETPVRLAHHLHASAQLIEAARRGLPALALIRRPQDAILSQIVREPDVAMREALIAYTRFYASLLSYRARFVVADFEDVTSDFGAVTRRLNEKFGLSLDEFDATAANKRSCSELQRRRSTLSPALLGFESGTVSLSELRQQESGSATGTLVEERDAWVPSAGREQAKAALLDAWLRPGLAKHRERAESIYREFRRD